MVEHLPIRDYAKAVAPDKIRLGDYELTISPTALDFMHWADQSQDKIFQVTFRSITEYEDKGIIPRGLVREVVGSDLQVVESGAGLAEFVPYIALNSRKKPIVIDPLNYSVINDLLVIALNKFATEQNVTLIQRLLQRIDIYQNPKLVTLYNMTLNEACKRNPHLQGIADVVLDVNGALLYSDKPQEAYQLESDWLLKKYPRGRFYHPFR